MTCVTKLRVPRLPNRKVSILAVCLAVSLSLGTSPVPGKPLIAHAQSLHPTYTAPEKQYVVKQERVHTTVETPQAQPQVATGEGELMGSSGYASPFGNCVLEVPASIRPMGNPITWAVTSQTPRIGSVALFNFNHVGIVTGIWSNGDLEIRHQNWHGGNQHRFPRSAFRGFR